MIDRKVFVAHACLHVCVCMCMCAIGCADLMTLDTMTPQERKRQGYIHELIQTEETYVEDLELVLEVFHKPMSESGRLTETEMSMIFVNWRELIMCNTKLLK